MHELRVTAHSPLPPGAIMDTLWKPQEYPEFITYLKRVDVLRDDGDTRLLYEQIRVPVVRDRDVTVRATRTSPAENEWEMRTVSDPGGPPESKEYVRIRKMESHWRLVADGDGTAVTYGVRTDAGGGWVPAWLLNAAQRDVTVKLVRAMLDRALEKHR